MKDRTSFFFAGANVLPILMVLTDESLAGLALGLYLTLMAAAVYSALRKAGVPLRGLFRRRAGAGLARTASRTE